MLNLTVEEVRNQFSAFMNQVRNGEEIIINEGGKPIALLKPYPTTSEMPETLDELLDRISVNLPDYRFDREEANSR